MTTPLAQGSAYMTFIFHAATVSIQSQNGRFTSVNGAALTTAASSITGTALIYHQVNVNSLLGSKFKVVNEKGHAYIMYTLSPITLSATNAGFTSSAQWSGVIRIAALNSTNPDAETALDTSSAVYPTSM